MRQITKKPDTEPAEVVRKAFEPYKFQAQGLQKHFFRLKA